MIKLVKPIDTLSRCGTAISYLHSGKVTEV